MTSRKAGTCLACMRGEVWYGPERVEIRLCRDHARIVDGVTGWRRAGVSVEK